MTSPLFLNVAPAAGFDEPFEMLRACHERVERMLGLLERLAAHLATQGADAEAAQAARDVMRYFDLAGPAHHEDEERHVFPALLVQGDKALRAVIGQLQQDHHAMSAAWAAVRADLVQVAAARGAVGIEFQAAGRWAAFAALYRRHIVAEETEVYPMARQWLDATARAAMGREMAARRGVV